MSQLSPRRVQCFYGPPGAGKSTRARTFAHSIDVEDFWPSSRHGEFITRRTMAGVRLQQALLTKGRVDAVAMAGLSLEQGRKILPAAEHILLLPPRSTYYPRRAARDAEQPWKSTQTDVYDKFAARAKSYDRVDTS